jgi:hypothetical protein
MKSYSAEGLRNPPDSLAEKFSKKLASVFRVPAQANEELGPRTSLCT